MSDASVSLDKELCMQDLVNFGLMSCGAAAALHAARAWCLFAAPGKRDSTALTDPEMSRLDALFTRGRQWHRLAASMAGFAVFGALAEPSGLGIWRLQLPVEQALLLLYVGVLGSTAVAGAYLLVGAERLDRDPREVPFAWLPLTTSRPWLRGSLILFPVVSCAMALEIYVGSVPKLGFGLATVFLFSAAASARELAVRRANESILTCSASLFEAVCWAAAILGFSIWPILQREWILWVGAICFFAGAAIWAGRAVTNVTRGILEWLRAR